MFTPTKLVADPHGQMGDTSSECTVNVPTATIGHVAVKPPAFYRQSPSVWFKQMESQFALGNITKSETKFHYILSALPEDVARNLSLDEGLDYGKLKETVLNSLKANKHQLIDEALSTIQLGDKRPSQLVVEIKRRFSEIGMTPDDSIIKSRLLSALPAHLRSALVGHDSVSVEQYGQIADSMLAVAGMSSSSPFTVAQVQQEKRFDNRHPRQNKFVVRPFHEGQKPRVCNAHIFYGKYARSCRRWCVWPDKPKRILRDGEKTPANSRPSSPSN